MKLVRGFFECPRKSNSNEFLDFANKNCQCKANDLSTKLRQWICFTLKVRISGSYHSYFFNQPDLEHLSPSPSAGTQLQLLVICICFLQEWKRSFQLSRETLDTGPIRSVTGHHRGSHCVSPRHFAAAALATNFQGTPYQCLVNLGPFLLAITRSQYRDHSGRQNTPVGLRRCEEATEWSRVSACRVLFRHCESSRL